MTDKEKTLAFIEERIKWNKDMMQCDPKPSDIGRIEEAKCIRRFIESLQEEPVSEELEEASRNYADNEEYGDDVYFSIKAAFKVGAKWQFEKINEVLLSEVLPCFMHGGEADEVVAKLDEVLNQKK